MSYGLMLLDAASFFGASADNIAKHVAANGKIHFDVGPFWISKTGMGLILTNLLDSREVQLYAQMRPRVMTASWRFQNRNQVLSHGTRALLVTKTYPYLCSRFKALNNED